MEVPSLVRSALGDEEIEASVNLGDEDTVYLTGSRTLLYRAEGLLSDEKVEAFTHDVESLDVKEGRRKTKFVLEYVDGTETFTVPSNRDDPVLELLMTGVLRAADVTGAEETLAGVFRFSELALFVTETSVVKHIGSSLWTSDFEVYAFEDLTELSFDRGSVATEIVIEIDGRPKRIKTPNDHARKVQQVVEDAVFQYYDVSSIDQLNAEIARTDDSKATASDGSSSDSGRSDIEIGAGIDPLVTDSDDADDSTPDATATGSAGQSRSSDQPRAESTEADAGRSAQTSATTSQTSPEERDAKSQRSETTDRSTQSTQRGRRAEVEAIEDHLDELTAVVERQNELLAQQQETIDRLIAELREGRG